MRHGGRFNADKNGNNPKRVEPIIGADKDGKGGKPNEAHHEYPDAKVPTDVGTPAAPAPGNNSK